MRPSLQWLGGEKNTKAKSGKPLILPRKKHSIPLLLETRWGTRGSRGWGRGGRGSKEAEKARGKEDGKEGMPLGLPPPLSSYPPSPPYGLPPARLSPVTPVTFWVQTRVAPWKGQPWRLATFGLLLLKPSWRAPRAQGSHAGPIPLLRADGPRFPRDSPGKDCNPLCVVWLRFWDVPEPAASSKPGKVKKLQGMCRLSGILFLRECAGWFLEYPVRLPRYSLAYAFQFHALCESRP